MPRRADTSSRWPVAPEALAGAAAAGAALGAGELVTGVDGAGVSLVTAVGDQFIDRFAGSLKDLAVALFGTGDKAALVVGIVVVALLLGLVVGARSAAHRWLAPLAFAAFGALGAWAYAVAPLTSATVGVAAGAVAAGTGTLTLWGLQRRSPSRPSPAPERSLSRDRSEPDRGAGPADGVAVDVDGEPVVVVSVRDEDGPAAGPSRRAFLTASALVTAGAGAAALAGRRLQGPDPTLAARAAVELPTPVDRVRAPSALPFTDPGLSPYVTPTDDFFRIDTALTIPRVDVGSWRLEVDGLVDAPLALGYEDLLAMDAVEVPVTLQCVSNEVGGDLVGTATWQGVPLERLLDRVRPHAEASQVVGRSVDGFTAGFPTEVLTDGRTALVAYAMNGEPLRPRHGFPARLVVAGLYGYVSATKWLRRIELTTWEGFDGYWVPRGWSKEGPIKVASRIDVPGPGARVASGTAVVAGVAWAPNVGVATVEVRVDDGPWLPCELGPAASGETWAQWWTRWDATPGDHVLAVRATDVAGTVQTSAVSPPRPDGATGHHARRVTVT